MIKYVITCMCDIVGISPNEYLVFLEVKCIKSCDSSPDKPWGRYGKPSRILHILWIVIK